MKLIELFQTIHDNWALLIFVFMLGGLWWQGTIWFKSVVKSLEYANLEHDKHTELLSEIKNKSEYLSNRMDKIEIIVVQIHDELHDQEIKLAVLESTAITKRRP